MRAEAATAVAATRRILIGVSLNGSCTEFANVSATSGVPDEPIEARRARRQRLFRQPYPPTELGVQQSHLRTDKIIRSIGAQVENCRSGMFDRRQIGAWASIS